MARHQSTFAFLSFRLAKCQPDVHRVEPTSVRKGDSSHPEHRSHSQYLFFQTGACKLCHHSWKHRQFSTKNISYPLHFPSLYSISHFLSKSCLFAAVSAYGEKTSLLCKHLAPAMPPKRQFHSRTPSKPTGIFPLASSSENRFPHSSSKATFCVLLCPDFTLSFSVFCPDDASNISSHVFASQSLPKRNHSPFCTGLKVELGSSQIKQKKHGNHSILCRRIPFQKTQELGALTSTLNPTFSAQGKGGGKASGLSLSVGIPTHWKLVRTCPSTYIFILK